MKKSLLILLLLLAGPLCADTESEIKMALDYFDQVWSEGDLESIRGYYHPDFVLVDENGIIPLAERMEDLETIAETGKDRGLLEYSQVKVRALEDKSAVAYGKFSLKFKDGSSFGGWFTTVYVNTPFGWKAILTHN